MAWEVIFHDAFAEEFAELAAGVQDELLARARLLEAFGPHLIPASARRDSGFAASQSSSPGGSPGDPDRRQAGCPGLTPGHDGQ